MRASLPEDLDRRARAALVRLVALVESLEPGAVEDPSLARGAAGLAMTWRALEGLDPAYAGRSTAWLERAVALANDGEIHFGLYTGLAGLCWMIELARDPAEEDPNLGMDALLLELVEGVSDAENLDVVGGLSGVAVYAAERLPRPSAAALLQAVAAQVAARAVALDGGVAWRMFPEMLDWQRGQGMALLDWNLGLSHGVPGPIAALALAQRWGLGDHAAPIEDGLRFLLSEDRDDRAFPATCDAAGATTRGHGAAWCYGGVGVGAWLQGLGVLLERPELAARGAEMMLRHAERHQDTRDMNLCHGHAGVAWMLWEAAARDERLQPAALDALERLLVALERPTWDWRTDQEPFNPQTDVLEGALGVALVLASMLAPGPVPLSRLLLTSLRGPG